MRWEMKTRAHLLNAPIFISIRRVSQPCQMFTPKTLYGCFSASNVALLIRKGAIFAHDVALLRRYSAHSLQQRRRSVTKKRLFAYSSALLS